MKKPTYVSGGNRNTDTNYSDHTAGFDLALKIF